MENQVKNLFLNHIQSIELSLEEKERMWNQLYAIFLMPLISDIFESIQRKDVELFQTDFCKRNYERIKSFYFNYPKQETELKTALFYFLQDKERIILFFFTKVFEKLNASGIKKTKEETEYFVHQCLANLFTMILSVQRIETSYKNSLDQVVDSMFADIASKTTFFANINQKQNEHFREKLLSQIQSIFLEDMKKKQKIENNILEIEEKMNQSLSKQEKQMKSFESSYEEKLIASNKRKITSLNKKIQEEGTQKNRWGFSSGISTIGIIIIAGVIQYLYMFNWEIFLPVCIILILFFFPLYYKFFQFSFLVKSKQEEKESLESENEELIKGISKPTSFTFNNANNVIAGSPINANTFTQEIKTNEQ